MKPHNPVGIILTDLHWGAVPPVRFQQELDKCLFEKIDSLKHLDFLIIGGDLFDMKEYLSSNVAKYILYFLNHLIERTEKFHTKIIIIEGTWTHDSLQLDTLSIIFHEIAKQDRIQFIHTVTDMKLCGMDVLFIPEEYVIDQELYYQDYFKNHYDLIVGHGMTDVIWYMRNEKSTEMKTQTSAPVFSVEKLCTIGNYVYFGHVHEHKAYGPNKRFKYVGPVSRWEFDKEWDCGYYLLEYDLHTKVMGEEFIINDYARIFRTTAFHIKEEIGLSELSKLVESRLDSLLKEADRIRIIVSLNPNLSNFMVIKDWFITKMALYKEVKLVLSIDEVSDTEEEKEIKEKKLQSSKQILEVGIPDEVRVSRFIKNNYNKNIPIEEIKETIGIS